MEAYYVGCMGRGMRMGTRGLLVGEQSRFGDKGLWDDKSVMVENKQRRCKISNVGTTQ